MTQQLGIRRVLPLLAGLGSADLLLGAMAFQFIGGLAPCDMCLWQRWPHVVALILALLWLRFRARLLVVLGALTMLGSAGLGLWHAGVERGWWEGPTTCTSANVSGLTPDQLLQQIMTAPIVRCDEIAWSFAGLSMAGWNAVISLVLAGVWIASLRMTDEAAVSGSATT